MREAPDVLRREVKVLAFDQYGTIVDMQKGLTEAVTPFLKAKGWDGKPNSFVTWWRRTHFENIPIKPQRVYEEMSKAFGRDTCYVSVIGLSQIAGAQFLGVYGPRNWINAGQAGPLGWLAAAVDLHRVAHRLKRVERRVLDGFQVIHV